MTQLLSNDKLSVFLFHKVPLIADPLLASDFDQKKFEEVIDFIRQRFNVYPLADAVLRLENGTLPNRSAAITFDDGYADWRTGAAKFLEVNSIPATFFITTGQFEGRPMWHERLANILRTFKGDVLDTSPYRLKPLVIRNASEKCAALQTLEFHFKYLPPVMRDIFLNEFEKAVGVSSSDVQTMSVCDLVAISNAGFEIGAHTVDHPILGLCDTKRARDEIAQPREVLEGLIKRPVKSFAYPNGRPNVDFSRQHIEMVKAAGYRYAVTTQWGVARPGSSLYQIPRFTPWGPSKVQMSAQILRNFYTEQDSLREEP